MHSQAGEIKGGVLKALTNEKSQTQKGNQVPRPECAWGTCAGSWMFRSWVTVGAKRKQNMGSNKAEGTS